VILRIKILVEALNSPPPAPSGELSLKGSINPIRQFVYPARHPQPFGLRWGLRSRGDRLKLSNKSLLGPETQLCHVFVVQFQIGFRPASRQ
jgi:hypothetical protein